MRKNIFLTLLLVVAGFAVAIPVTLNQTAQAQGRGAASPELIARRNSIENELQSIAIVERKLMIRLRNRPRIGRI